MTEEQNKLADEIDVLIGRLRMHAGASDTHIPRPLLATAADALAALREREPATDAVRDQVLEEAAKVCDEMPCDCCWHEDAQIMAETCAAAIRALKGKGASQGDEDAKR